MCLCIVIKKIAIEQFPGLRWLVKFETPREVQLFYDLS